MSSVEAAYSIVIPLTVCTRGPSLYPRKQRNYSKGRVGNPDKHISRSGNSPNATPPYPHGCAHVCRRNTARTYNTSTSHCLQKTEILCLEGEVLILTFFACFLIADTVCFIVISCSYRYSPLSLISRLNQ